jgi:hypothetical protein
MKELNTHNKLKDKIEVNARKNNQQEAELVLTGKITPENGHILFEINTITMACNPAKFNHKKNISFIKAKEKDYSGINDLIVQSDCVYIPALNKQNALRKFRDNPNQSAYYKKEALLNLTENFFT